MKKINAISFTPKYDALEDRIRISINYDDLQNRVDFMMTRSLVLKLFPILEEYMLKFYSVELEANVNVDEMISQTIPEKVLKSSTSITDGTNLELYKQEDELLLEVKFSYVKDTKISIVELMSKNSQATAHLSINDFKQIFSIIKSTIPSFSWGISHNF